MWLFQPINISIGTFLPYDLSSDMEPAGQAVYSGVFGSAAAGEGLHSTDCSTPSAAGPGPVGAERREGQSRWKDKPWPPRAPVCGPQQAAGRQSWCTSVSGLCSLYKRASERTPLFTWACKGADADLGCCIRAQGGLTWVGAFRQRCGVSLIWFKVIKL